jgi:hypothetical protein
MGISEGIGVSNKTIIKYHAGGKRVRSSTPLGRERTNNITLELNGKVH